MALVALAAAAREVEHGQGAVSGVGADDRAEVVDDDVLEFAVAFYLLNDVFGILGNIGVNEEQRLLFRLLHGEIGRAHV